jgi:hypothetical protein
MSDWNILLCDAGDIKWNSKKSNECENVMRYLYFWLALSKVLSEINLHRDQWEIQNCKERVPDVEHHVCCTVDTALLNNHMIQTGPDCANVLSFFFTVLNWFLGY